MNKDGFMLIELALYCVISALLSTLVCAIAIRYTNGLKKLSTHAVREQAYFCGQAKILTKLRELPVAREAWKLISNNELIVKTEQEDKGFSFENGNLYYLYGIYNENSYQWIKKKKELAIAHVPSGSWRVLMTKTEPQYIQAVILQTDNSPEREYWVCPGKILR